MYKDIISGIYCIENIITHKKYIGQSINIKDRWSKHKSELNHQTHDNDYLQKAWNKYGENNFKFYIIERCNFEDLNEKQNNQEMNEEQKQLIHSLIEKIWEDKN